MKEKCEVGGCDREQHAKGLCVKHYSRLRNGGDPHTPSRQELSVEERFRAKLAPQDPVTGCIEWTGFRQPFGHGLIRRDGKNIGTHRLAWELKHGPIPEGLDVLHKCDNPPCCNEDHLFLGTQADNVADRTAKGRTAKGETHCRAKLSDVDVSEIRRRLAAREVQRVIASDFGVSVAQISLIKLGKTRKQQV